MNPHLRRIRHGLSCSIRRSLRRVEDAFAGRRWAQQRDATLLPVRILDHRLPIRRRLAGVDPVLFENKRTNLRLAIERLDGIRIAPAETFSFWRLVGTPSASRGYLEGLALLHGAPARSVGGGLCQLANLLFWMALHSDLEIIERHHHSLDLFPDDCRRVPFGTGASILYNFKDLRFYNPTERTFQFVFDVTESELGGSLLCSERPRHVYKLVERDHRFLNRPDGLYRQNTIIREALNTEDARIQAEQILFRNNSKCRYSLEEVVT